MSAHSQDASVEHSTQVTKTRGISPGGDMSVGGNVWNFVNSPINGLHVGRAKTSFRCVPSPTKYYEGRSAILHEIQSHFSRLKTPPNDCWSRMVSIVGLGGIGKSETAWKFAKLNKEIYPNVAWINAETEQSTLEGFLNLAKNLEIVSVDQQSANSNLVKMVYNHIDENCKDSALIIFDNAIKLKSNGDDFGVFNYLPTEELSNGQYPFIIITSQNPSWGDIKTFHLKELSEDESLKFLKSSLNVSSSAYDEKFQKLHNLLQGYPLAMTIAASNIQIDSQEQEEEDFTNCLEERIDHYIERFQLEDSQVLTEIINERWPSEYSKTLSTTWQLSFTMLQKAQNGTDALYLLQAISFFHVPVNIKDLTEVFIECPWCPDTPDWIKFDRLKKSMRLLRRYFAVVCDFKKLDYSAPLSLWDQLRVHRLVQFVVRQQMKCNHVLEDILRFVGFRASAYYVRQLNVPAVEEALERIQLTTRAKSFVGIIACKGNVAARRILKTRSAGGNPAATIWRVFHLNKDIETLNYEAVQALKKFIGLSTSDCQKNLIDKRSFALMAMEMLVQRRVFPHVRDDGTSAWGIYLDSYKGIDNAACELFLTACTFTKACSLPLLCNNVNRNTTAYLTLRLGNIIIENFTKVGNNWKPDFGVAEIIEMLATYREILDAVHPTRPKWDEYLDEKSEILHGAFWKKFESELQQSGPNRWKLSQVFGSLFEKILSASSNKNLSRSLSLKAAFEDLDFAVCNCLIPQRSPEFLLSLTSAYADILVLSTEDQLLLLLHQSPDQLIGFVVRVFSTWMKIFVAEGDLSSDALVGHLSRVKLIAEVGKIPVERIRAALENIRDWAGLQERHTTTYANFIHKHLKSNTEEIQCLVTICKEIQEAMPVGPNSVRPRLEGAGLLHGLD